MHNALIDNGLEQTWYFAIVDCQGHLEIYRDEDTKRDHLLGLNVLWSNIDEQDFAGYESEHVGITDEQRMAASGPQMGINDNEDPDSYVSTYEAIENIHQDRDARAESYMAH